MLDKNKKIYVAGHRGMVGSAVLRQLEEQGFDNTVVRSHQQLDLVDQQAVQAFFAAERPDYVVMAAAKVGGIHANNTYPAEFIYENLMVQCNLIHAAYGAGVERLLFLGSSCIYPKLATQPIREEELMHGALEPTNEPYAVAKIAGIKLCESYNRQYGTDFRSVMPTNLYGPNDNFHPHNSHVIPALLRRVHEAKVKSSPSITVWGTGTAMREFLHVDDMAQGSLYVLGLDREKYQSHTSPMSSHVNIGSGKDITIKELVHTVKEVVGYPGELLWDSTKPDGAPRKLLDVSKLNGLGWKYSIDLEQGLRDTYAWYEANLQTARSL